MNLMVGLISCIAYLVIAKEVFIISFLIKVSYKISYLCGYCQDDISLVAISGNLKKEK